MGFSGTISAQKDVVLRVFVDYRRHDAATEREHYSTSRMDECSDCVGEAAMLSTIDSNAPYWVI